MGYPSWRYHREHGGKIIHSQAEEAEGWEDSPAKVQLEAYDNGSGVAFKKLPAESYKEHMAEWESKEEKKKPGRPKKEKA